MEYITYIVTHPGQAHRDDFLAVAIALALEGNIAVYRREPTPKELEDPAVLVLDVGGRHEPEKNNFDHHQRGRDELPECALSLYLQARGLDEIFKLRPWYRSTILMDATGPGNTAKALELPRFPFELSSPIEGALIEQFEKRTEFSDDLLDLLWFIGATVLSNAKQAMEDYKSALETVKTVEIKGVLALVWESTIPKQSQAVRDAVYPTAGLSLSHDDRGAGWSLYRFNDCPCVDFSRLEGKPEVSFAHKGGFIAKTHKRFELSEAIALCGEAVSR